MKLSKRTFILLFAMIVFAVVRMHGGEQYGPPAPPIPPDYYPMDPPDPYTDPFNPFDLPDPNEIDFPPEWPGPPEDDEIPLPYLDLEDPYPALEPSLFPDTALDDFPPPPILPTGHTNVPESTNVPGRHPHAVAINTVTPLIEFPRRIWFSPHVTAFGSGARLNCSAQFQNRLLVPESKANSVAVLNTCPYGLSGKIPVGKKPIAVVTTPDGQSALVSNVDGATISVINLANLAVSQTISLPPFNGVAMRPSGIAILPDGSKAYVADHVALPGSVAYVIDLSTMKFTGTTLPTGDFPQSIAVTPDGSQVWVGSWGGGRVDVFDTLTNAPLAAFNVPSANGIAFNPNGTRAYIASGQSPGYVQVVDVQALQTIVQIPVGNLPHAVRVTPTGRHVFVTNVLSNSISQIDTGTNTVLRTVTLKGQHPLGLAFIAKSPF
jgi:YVTN family beta-propeller protein